LGFEPRVQWTGWDLDFAGKRVQLTFLKWVQRDA
jgi:hypothetical protein